MSVARCQVEVSSAEFTDWIAFSQIEHMGSTMDDLRAGLVAAAIYNVNRNTEKHPTPFGPRDVVPWLSSVQDKPEAEPVLFDDPVAQTNLLRAHLFGRRNGKAG
ncbi:phage tail assembly protein T [Burkholderia gladioli]|uniref:phage tail assembly protein T n=1 Tax=Burkholderia gladioli TaxID=28095 RepID=UPI001641E02B|nr:hypothetical protein [Burkholderia gladioli]